MEYVVGRHYKRRDGERLTYLVRNNMVHHDFRYVFTSYLKVYEYNSNGECVDMGHMNDIVGECEELNIPKVGSTWKWKNSARFTDFTKIIFIEDDFVMVKRADGKYDTYEVDYLLKYYEEV